MEAMITRDILIAHNVCKEGLFWFDREFPRGCAINDLFLYEGEIKARYVWWYYLNTDIRDELFALLKGWLPDYSKPAPWKKIPMKALDYILALPEFDAAIFKEITVISAGKTAATQPLQPPIHEILPEE